MLLWLTFVALTASPASAQQFNGDNQWVAPHGVATLITFAFREATVSWDLLPGVIVNLDEDQSGKTAWGMTWSSRLAVYKIIPQSAVVAEVFGTAGEAYAEPTYRVGVRWESPRVIVAANLREQRARGLMG